MAHRILKNNTGSAVPIGDVGQSVPASGQLVIAPQDYGKYEGSSDVITLISDLAVNPTTSTLTVNDGTFDLGISEGTRLIQGGFSRPIPDGDDPTVKAKVTSSTGVTEYDKRLIIEGVLAGLDALGAFRRVNTKVRSDGLIALATDTGDVNVTSKALSDLYLQRASLNGLGVDFDMTVNGSLGSPVIFRIEADPDTDIFIQEIRFYGSGNGIQFNRFLNLNQTLTNGILVEIKSEDVITDLILIKSTEDFKNFFSFPGGDAFRLDIASGRDDFLATFQFPNPFLINTQGTHGAGNDDYIEIRIQDNLNQVGSLGFLAKGFEKEP